MLRQKENLIENEQTDVQTVADDKSMAQEIKTMNISFQSKGWSNPLIYMMTKYKKKQTDVEDISSRFEKYN